mgnify:FL=1
MRVKGAHLRSSKELKEYTTMLEKKGKLYTLIIGIIGAIMMLISGVMLVASRDSHYMAIGFVVLIMFIGFCLLIGGIYID